MRKGKGDRWVFLIGVLKLCKGLVLVGVALGGLNLLHKNLADEVQRWANAFNIDVNSRLFRAVLAKVAHLSPQKLRWLCSGTFLYSALFLTEGVGLVLRKRWGEYCTIIITGSFLPLEIYEVCRKFDALRLILLLVNAAIVVYLIARLSREKSASGETLSHGRRSESGRA